HYLTLLSFSSSHISSSYLFSFFFFFFFNAPTTTEIYTLSLHDALPIWNMACEPYPGIAWQAMQYAVGFQRLGHDAFYFETSSSRSEEHTSELQSRGHLVCRLLLEKKKQDGNKLSHSW